MMAAFTQNQLLFNLDIPSRPLNLATTYNRPEAIVIEKFTPSSSGPVITAPRSVLRLSSVSEESLTAAVQLAKRDLKKQREQEALTTQHRQEVKKGRGAGKKKQPQRAVPGGKAANVRAAPIRSRGAQIVHDAGYKDRMKQREERWRSGTEVVLVKERERGRKARPVSTQTKHHATNLPVRSMSPPTRDTDPSNLHGNPGLSGDAKTLADIKNMRAEMEKCLEKIRQTQEAAKRNPSVYQRPTPVYAEDIEAERKRVMRVEEQTARSSRTVYMLTQQVRDLQNDVDKLGPANINQNKQSQLLSRLAAAHRGATRVLQAFLQHLPDHRLEEGMPRGYHDLGLLLRQLSLCCAQLEVAGETGVPESVVNLLKDYAELNKALDSSFRSSPKTPPRPCQVAHEIHDKKKRSPASRKLLFDEDVRRVQRSEVTEVRKSPVIKETITHTKDKAVDATPDRQAALRAGIAALVRAVDSAPSSPRGRHQSPRARSPRGHHRSPVPPLDLPRTPRGASPRAYDHGPRVESPRGRAVAWEYPLEQPRLQQWKASSGAKGLLLPAKLQKKRQKQQQQRSRPSAFQQAVAPPASHYADSTLSSRMKEVPPGERPPVSPRSPRSPRRYNSTSPGRPAHSPRPSSLPSSPWGRSPSPWSSARSPRARSPYSSARSPGASPRTRSRSPGFSGHQDILRLVQADREKTLRQSERARIDQLRHDLGQPREWVDAAEGRIREKLQPILDEACVEVNADLLAESLLKDLLEDTAREMGEGEDEEDVELQAKIMQQAPSVETMLQRLHQMEDEQQEIRRRWATLVYEEENSDIPARAKYFDAPLLDQPSSPTPIHLTSQLPPPQGTLLPDHVINRLESQPSDSQAILFTKPNLKPVQHTTIHLSQLASGGLSLGPDDGRFQEGIPYFGATPISRGIPKNDGIPLCLSPEIHRSIEANRKEFEKHLKMMSYQSVGRFNPWEIMEEVANEIVEDCLGEVSRELDQINSDIVNSVYSTEFSKIPSPAGATANKPPANDRLVSGAPLFPYSTQSNAASPQLTTEPHQDKQSTAVNTKLEIIEKEMQAELPKSGRGDDVSQQNSQKEAVPSNARSPSPEYSYDDDFVESEAAQGKSMESGRKSMEDLSKSEHSESWHSNGS